MKNIFRSHTQGQSLVFFVLISVVLIGILAFALDMGYTYYMRRWAQNSADSAALAAARELCITPVDDPGRLDKAIAAGKYYAEERNLATNFAENSTNISLLSDYEIEATVTITHPTIVAGFFGQEFLVVPAVAAAGCFAPELAKVIPISWKCRYWGDPDDPKCKLQFEDDDGCDLGDDYYYVFLYEDGDFDDPQKFFCNNWPGNPDPLGPKQEILDCDYYDGIEYFQNGADMEVVSPLDPEHSWSWIDLIVNGQGSTSELTTVISEGSPNPVDPPVWVYETPGVVTTLFETINGLIPDDFAIPIFDVVCDHTDPGIPDPTGHPMDDCPGKWQTGDNIIPKAGTIKKSYRLVGFAWLDIQCVDAGSVGPCPGREFLNMNNQISPSINSFEGCFKQGVVPGPGGQGNPGGTLAGAWTLYLTR